MTDRHKIQSLLHGVFYQTFLSFTANEGPVPPIGMLLPASATLYYKASCTALFYASALLRQEHKRSPCLPFFI